MPVIPVSFAQHSYKDLSQPVSAQRLLNLYLDQKPQEAKNRTALHGTPGLKLWITVGSGPCRGLHRMGVELFVVSGNELYSVHSTGATNLIGEINGYLPVSMASDGTNLVIVSDTTVYWATATAMGVLDVPPCRGVAYQDGYLILAERDSQAFFVNNTLADPVSPPQFDPTEFALSNAYPDNNTGIVNVNRETIIFGVESAQKYYNSGDADFPFDRTPSGVIERGCISARSVAAYLGLAVWLGDDLSVYSLEGDIPVKLSTAPIDRLIASYPGHSSAQAIMYSQNSHIFYTLTFAGGGTIAYDFTTGKWHERQTYGYNEWIARCHSHVFKKHLVGSAVNGDLLELDNDTYTDNGAPVIRSMTAPPISATSQLSKVVMHRLQVDCETGVGLNSGQGSDPQMMLDWSDNGGRQWSSEHWRSIGKIGQYKSRAIWKHLGSFRERVYRLTMSDPVKAAWFEGYAMADGARG